MNHMGSGAQCYHTYNLHTFFPTSVDNFNCDTASGLWCVKGEKLRILLLLLLHVLHFAGKGAVLRTDEWEDFEAHNINVSMV